MESLADAFGLVGREVADGTTGDATDGAARAAGGRVVPVLDAAVQIVVRRIDGADWCSVTAYRPGPTGARSPGPHPTPAERRHAVERGEFVTVAATDERARRADRIQYELGSGPCLDAITHDPVYAPDDLAADDRWPDYGRRASQEVGVGSMLSFRMALETDDVVGGLNVYAQRTHAFDAQDRDVGAMLAAYCAVAIAAATSRDRVDDLEVALRSSREIGTAMGILMQRHTITREEAFGLLRLASQARNRKLRDVATEVADTGALDVPDLTRRLPRQDG